MKKELSIKQELTDELHTKWILSDMKNRLVQIICNLLDDQVYIENDIIYSLLEVVELIDLEEKKVNPNAVKEKLENFGI
ncbi:hypothetical protein NSA56_07625 [Oceanobacillus caeni]|uniref:hypothetical protein n=1 Tax=Oceanobacillus caeni TaxID=405946 RepID=UPI00195863C3|nr:hypothetical protein [Oceanobacillus caeni]MCR1834266.1 hypothetical protein [Oceanobacillus caeni]